MNPMTIWIYSLIFVYLKHSYSNVFSFHANKILSSESKRRDKIVIGLILSSVND